MKCRYVRLRPGVVSVCIASLLTILIGQCLRAQSGHVLDGYGPVDQALGGATTALPQDAIGSIHRNPGSIRGLECSEIGFGFAAFAPSTQMASRIDEGAFGPGFPPVALSGSSNSDIDITPIPSMGFVHRSDDSIWAYGIGGFGVGGFGVDFPASTSNPILTPQAPNGFGFGAVYSDFQMLQISTPIACQLTDRVAVGVAPLFNWASLAVSPFAAASPDDANGNGFGTYPSGSHSDARWGLGLDIGIYYENPCSGWNLGLSYKTTTFFQEFKINSQDELGLPRVLNFNLDYPAILSMGVAYTGFDRWIVSSDLRYVDYQNTDGFNSVGYDPTGRVTGFGWDSIWVAAMGLQYELCEHVQLRCGYTYNDSPVGSPNMFYNVPAPALVQHHINAGFSWLTPHDWVLSFAYHHGFENKVSGRWQTPFGEIPGARVRSELSTHTMVGSVAKRF